MLRLHAATLARAGLCLRALAAPQLAAHRQRRGLASKSGAPSLQAALLAEAAEAAEAARRSARGIAPIDTEGRIKLVEEGEEDAKGEGGEWEEVHELDEQDADAAHSAHSAPRARPATSASSNSSPSSAPPSRSTFGRDDLTKPPTLPASTTHSTARPGTAAAEGLLADPLQPKSAWKSPSGAAITGKKGKKVAEQSAPQRPSTEDGWLPLDDPVPDLDFSKLRPSSALPSGMGWAQARSQALGLKPAVPGEGQQSEAADGKEQPSAPEWTDADFLLLFPHLRFLRPTAAGEEADEGPLDDTTQEASPEQQAANVATIRARYSELQTLHLGSTWVKVRKWRELLGASRPLEEEGRRQLEQEEARAVAEGARAPASLPEGFPANALHPRYYQPDLHLSAREVGSILLRERDLLYLSIEKVAVKRMNILRTNLPGINLAPVLTRNPSLLLADLQAGLPAKLADLRSVFPEVNLASLLERDSRLLRHDVASYVLPRLNLLQAASGYRPEHVVHMVVENPHILAVRWNRLKRLEVVKQPRFWEWWRSRQTQTEGKEEQGKEVDSTAAEPASQAADSNPTDSTSSTPSASASPSSSTSPDAADPWAPPDPRNDPSSLPFSLYVDLATWSAERFAREFPWFELRFSPLEKELLEARSKGAGKKGSKKGKVLTSEPSPVAQLTDQLTPDLLASVPGNPQPLAQALGLQGADMTRLERRAAQRMEYLALKQAKAERKARQRAFMAEREAQHQREKMQAYTQRFQLLRGKALAGEADKTPPPASAPAASRSGEWSSGQQWPDASASASSSAPRAAPAAPPRAMPRHLERVGASERHQKNRPGSAALARHLGHSAGTLERLGTVPSSAAQAVPSSRAAVAQQRQQAARSRAPYRFGDSLILDKAGSTADAPPASEAPQQRATPPRTGGTREWGHNQQWPSRK